MTHNSTRHNLTTFFAASLAWLAGTLAASANAQVSDADRYAARTISRIALADLRFQPEPTPSDYQIAADLFQLASELDPENATYLRRQIETLRNAGDDQGVIDATRALVRLDPKDTVAQLRLISWQINRLQTVEERLDAYRKFLGDAGKRLLDDSVRSRLALDASLLAQEAGETNESDDLLLQSATLDPSNKDAAALALTRFGARTDDPVERFRLMANLLLADPIDPNTHASIAGLLVDAGTFEEAVRFFEISGRLTVLGGGEPGQKAVERRLSLQWWNNGPEVLLDALELQLIQQREAAAEQLRQVRELGESTQDLRNPEDIRLEVAFEPYRVLTALSLRRPASARTALDDMSRSVDEFNRRAGEVSTSGDLQGQQLSELRRFAAQYSATLITLRLLAGEGVTEARQRLSVLREANVISPLTTTALEGMVLLRAGQPGAALDLLEPIADRDASIKAAIALSYEQLGLNEQAITAFSDAARDGPLTPLGVYCAEKYQQLTGEPLQFSAMKQELASLSREMLPSWIDRMVDDPYTFMRLHVEPLALTVGGLEPSHLRVSLKNLAPIPLALGPGKPIGSRFLLSPAVEIDAEVVRVALAPEVIDLSRRLHLAPREEMNYTVEAMPGIEGDLLSLRCARRVRSRWRALQSFQITGEGQYGPGPLSISAQTDMLVRAPVPLARRGAEAVASRLDIAEDQQLAEAMGVVRALFTDSATDPTILSEEDKTLLANSIVRRVPVYDRAMRLIAAASVPPSTREPVAADFEDAAWAEQDPDLRMMMLITRATSPEYQGFVIAENSTDPRLRRFAAALKDRLERSKAGFAAFNGPAARP